MPTAEVKTLLWMLRFRFSACIRNSWHLSLKQYRQVCIGACHRTAKKWSPSLDSCTVNVKSAGTWIYMNILSLSVFEVFSRHTIKLLWDPTAMVHKRICLQSLRWSRFALLLRLALRPAFFLDVTLLFLVSPSNLPLDTLFGKTKA
jgi:hypothetical protein